MSDEELPSTSREVQAEAEEVKRKREVHNMFADGQKQDAEVYSSSAFGGTEHGGKAEFSSHLQSFRCLFLCAQEHAFLCSF